MTPHPIARPRPRRARVIACATLWLTLLLPPATHGADGTWQELLSAPVGRDGHAAVYDSQRGRMLMFGGYDGEFYRNDIWALLLTTTPAWTRVGASGTAPSGRYGSTVVYDSGRDQLVIFGGYNGARLADVWTLTLSGTPAWTQITPAGTPPSGRSEHTAIYDAPRNRMIVFGGYDGARRNDVWALTLSGTPTWSQLAPGGTPPTARREQTAIFDGPRNRMLVFGGDDGSPRNDTWALSLSGTPAWTLLAPSGPTPAARSGHLAVYDATRQRMVIFAGFGTSARNDTWALPLTGTLAWSQILPSGSLPTARFGPVGIYDSTLDRMVSYGGFDGAYDADIWSLALAGTPAWSQASTPAVFTPARASHAAAYDSYRQRLLIFGGYDGTNFLNDAWALPLSTRAAWSKLPATGTPPSVRSDAAAVYDPPHERLLIFGGYDGTVFYRNDVWSLTLGALPAWAALAPLGTPPSGRAQLTANLDAARNRVVIYGGSDGGSYYSEVWTLSLGDTLRWVPASPGGAPPPGRKDHTTVYDSARDRLIVFGGYDGVTWRNDVWALDLAGGMSWTQLLPGGTPPPGLAQHAAIYDAAGDRMLVYGGFDGSFRREEVWELSLGATPQWRLTAPAGMIPIGRFEHAAVYDEPRHRLVMCGGTGNSAYFNGTWVLWDPDALDVPPVAGGAPRGLWLAPAAPNPARTSTLFRFGLPRPDRVTLRVLDPAGRTVATLLDAPLAAGPHDVRWDLRAGGAAAPPGVYLCELRAGGGRVTRRTVVLR